MESRENRKFNENESRVITNVWSFKVKGNVLFIYPMNNTNYGFQTRDLHEKVCVTNRKGVRDKKKKERR